MQQPPPSKKPRASNVSICALAAERLTDAEEMPRELSWNPGVETRHLCDGTLIPKGSVLIAQDQDGKVLGMLSGARQGQFGWVGLYIVRDPDLRGRGIGTQLWRAVMDGPLRGCKGMGLDGVAEQVAKYRRSGFVHSPYDVVRHSGTLGKAAHAKTTQAAAAAAAQSAAAVAAAAAAASPLTPVLVTGSELVEACIRYDAERVFKTLVDRKEFLRGWLTMEGARALAVKSGVDDGQVLGFALMRPAQHDSVRVGPVYADSAEVAGVLLGGLREWADGRVVHLDVPSANQPGLDLAKQLGLCPGFTCKRMYFGAAPPEEDVSKQFGVVCWELTC